MKKKACFFAQIIIVVVFPLLFLPAEKSFGFWDNLFPKNSSPQSVVAGTDKTSWFKSFKYIDKDGIGIEAFEMLIPYSWNFEGGIKWVMDNPGMPASASFKIYNPAGSEEFEVFPNQPFFWTNNQMVLSMFGPGSRYFGNEVAAPVSSANALRHIVLPRFRSDVNQLKIIKEEFLPELARAIGAGKQVNQPGVTVKAEGAKIRIEYERAGQIMEEEIFAVVESMSYLIPARTGMVNNINWVVDYIFSCKAKKGELDSNSKTFQTIIRSFRLNPQWFNKYNQLIEYLAQMQIKQIQNTGQISKIISQTNNEISNMITDTYNRRQNVNDKIADNFSKTMRGVEDYHDPIDQKTIELPIGYREGWTNNRGEYILSDDPNFNPNVGSTVNWQKMDKKD